MIRFDDMNVIDITAPAQLLTRRRDERYLLLKYPELQDIHDRWATCLEGFLQTRLQRMRRDPHGRIIQSVLPTLSITIIILILPSIHPVFA